VTLTPKVSLENIRMPARATRRESSQDLQLHPIGVIRSALKVRSAAPRQASEGAPDAWIEINTPFLQALDGVKTGDEIVVLTWLHQARRETLKV
jgi:tRNA (Thr-GGU) A37 N-methylase